MTIVDLEALRADVGDAFKDVPRPAKLADMLSDPYASNEDAHQMAAAFFRQPWGDTPVLELFRHRQMLFALSPNGFRAFLPAYLVAAINEDEDCAKYAPDIREHLVHSLWPVGGSDEIVSTTNARLVALSPAQRAATLAVLKYLGARWNMRDVVEAVRALEIVEQR